MSMAEEQHLRLRLGILASLVLKNWPQPLIVCPRIRSRLFCPLQLSRKVIGVAETAPQVGSNCRSLMQ